jgi:hypothetical protein
MIISTLKLALVIGKRDINQAVRICSYLTKMYPYLLVYRMFA